MKCSSVRKLLSEYVDGVLPDRRNLQIEEHLHNCADCRHYADSYINQINNLNSVMQSAESCSFEVGDIADMVVRRLEQERRSRVVVPIASRLRGLVYSSVVPISLFIILTLAITVLFYGIVEPVHQASVYLHSGRQFSYTARPSTGGRVETELNNRSYARIESPKSRWAR